MKRQLILNRIRSITQGTTDCFVGRRFRWLRRIWYIALPIVLFLFMHDYYSWRPHQVFQFVGEPIQFIEFASDGNRAVVTTKTRLVYVDVEQETIIWQRIAEIYDPARFIPKSKYVVGNCSGQNYRQGTVWDAETGEIKAQLKGPIPSGIFSPDGRLLAARVQNAGYKLPVWDVSRIETGKISQVLGLGTAKRIISDITFSPDGQTLAATSWTGGNSTVEMWNIKNGQLRGKLSTKGGLLAWSPDGRLLAVATDDAIEFWDVRSKHRIRSVTAPAQSTRYLLKFSPDGKLLLCEDGISLQILNTKTDQVTPKRHMYNGSILGFSSDSNYAYGLDNDRNAFSLRLR